MYRSFLHWLTKPANSLLLGIKWPLYHFTDISTFVQHLHCSTIQYSALLSVSLGMTGIPGTASASFFQALVVCEIAKVFSKNVNLCFYESLMIYLATLHNKSKILHIFYCSITFSYRYPFAPILVC